MSIVLPFAALLVLLVLASIPVLIIGMIARFWPATKPAHMPAATPPPAARSSARPAAPQAARPTARTPYARIPTLLTAAERDCFAVLQAALPAGQLLFAQVRLANMVQVQPWAQRDKSHWWRIQAKCVDFVLVDAATFAPTLVIELDDASHDRADRRKRDAFVDQVLAAISLPILHVRWQRQYDQHALATQIAERLGIAAPMPIAAPWSAAAPVVANASWQPPVPVPAVQYQAAMSRSLTPTQISQRRACGQCQAELRADARFCNQCGASFG